MHYKDCHRKVCWNSDVDRVSAVLLFYGDFSDFRKLVFFPGAVACFIEVVIFVGHCESPACGRTVFVNRAISIFIGGTSQGDTSGSFLVSAAHTAIQGGYLLSETDRDLSASIVRFSPVKRDAEKSTTGTTRHAWIRIVHNSPVQLWIVKETTVPCMQKRTVVGWCTFDSAGIEWLPVVSCIRYRMMRYAWQSFTGTGIYGCIQVRSFVGTRACFRIWILRYSYLYESWVLLHPPGSDGC